MIKKTLTAFLSLIMFLFLTTNAFASGFNLKSIGSVNTEGRQISHWWYTGTNPALSGEAEANSTINIIIDGESKSTTADSSGNWSYTLTGLNDGDHNIILDNNGSKINFVLTLGKDNVDWDVVGKESSNTALPVSGATLPTVTMLGIGAILLVLGRKFLYQT